MRHDLVLKGAFDVAIAEEGEEEKGEEEEAGMAQARNDPRKMNGGSRNFRAGVEKTRPIHGYISRVRLGRGSNKSLQASKQRNTRSKFRCNRPTNRPTDQPTDMASYRVACTRLKSMLK